MASQFASRTKTSTHMEKVRALRERKLLLERMEANLATRCGGQ